MVLTFLCAQDLPKRLLKVKPFRFQQVTLRGGYLQWNLDFQRRSEEAAHAARLQAEVVRSLPLVAFIDCFPYLRNFAPWCCGLLLPGNAEKGHQHCSSGGWVCDKCLICDVSFKEKGYWVPFLAAEGCFTQQNLKLAYEISGICCNWLQFPCDVNDTNILMVVFGSTICGLENERDLSPQIQSVFP